MRTNRGETQIEAVALVIVQRRYEGETRKKKEVVVVIKLMTGDTGTGNTQLVAAVMLQLGQDG